MKSIDYWNELTKDFHEKYFQILANPYVSKLSYLNQDELFSCPAILLYGADISILKMYVRSILQSIFKTIILPKSQNYEFMNGTTKSSAQYLYSDYHIEIDLELLGSGEKQFITEFIYNNIGNTKHINQSKHIVVLHNLSCMSSVTQYSLRRPLEVFSNNILFIFTSPSLNKIERAITSRFMFIQCSIPDENMEKFIDVFVENKDIENTIELNPNDTISHNILKLSLKDDNTETKIEKKIHEFLDKLLKEKNIFKACELIRTFGYKLLHFNLTIAYIMRVTISYITKFKKLKPYIYDIVSLSANLEHQSVNIAKNIIIFEKYFLKIYQYTVLGSNK
jgi:hypothetical protein